MPAEQNEQEIQFKKRARRRLVGAIALVLLMVTVLPMLLDDRSVKTPQQEIAINIPSQQDADFTSKVVPVLPETFPPSESTGTDDNLTEEATAPVAPEAASPTPQSEQSMVSEKPAEKAAEKPVADKAEPEKSAAQKSTPAVAASGAYAVQIGVYSTMASIKDLQQKLLAQGFKTYTEKVATGQGEKIRLRAGPFASRDDAEKALAKIKSAGMAGMVVSR